MQTKPEKAEPVKFSFGPSFGESEHRTPSASELAFQKAVNEAREEGYAAGRAEGNSEALAGIEAATQALIAQLGMRLSEIEQQHASRQAEMRSNAAKMAFAIAAKLAPALMHDHPLKEIEALVAECLANAPTEPRMLVRVAEPLVEPLNERIDSLKAAAGFMGQIILLGDPEITFGDCRVEWPDGGLERNTTTLMDDIEAAVQRYVIASN